QRRLSRVGESSRLRDAILKGHTDESDQQQQPDHGGLKEQQLKAARVGEDQFGVALRQQTELLPQRRVVGPWYLARRRLHHDRPRVRGEWPGLFDLLGERFALFWFARQLRGHPPGDVFLVKRAVEVPLVPDLRLFLREFRVDRADAVNAEVAGGLARRPVIDH